MEITGKVMLLGFSFENLYSFRDASTLDMRALPDDKNPEHIVDFGGNKILSAASIYGANASGKTKFAKILYKFFHSISCSPSFGDATGSAFPYGQTFWLSDETRAGNVKHTAYFQTEDRAYKYSFSARDKCIVWEELRHITPDFTDGDLLFERSSEEVRLEGELKNNASAENLIAMIKGNRSLFISWLGINRISPAKEIYDWCGISRSFWEYGEHSECRENLKALIECKTDSQKDTRLRLLNFAQKLDHSIVDLRIVRNENKAPYISYVRKDPKGKEVSFPEEMESYGTMRLLLLYPQIMKILNSGGIFVVDEFDRQIHPLALRNLVGMFHDKNTNTGKAQLIFTTHNPVLLNFEDMRDDEIWFIAKDKAGASKLYPLIKYDLTGIEKSKLYLEYLSGRFDGIPRLV